MLADRGGDCQGTAHGSVAADPPAADLYGTLILLIVSVIIMLWLTGKVFRMGILRTGQPPKIVDARP